jgi:hypothetical protein
MALQSSRQIVFVFLNVLAIYHLGHGCSQPRNWRSKGASLRAIHADFVILGKVVQSPFPTRQRSGSRHFGPYDARFRIICALKGRPRAKYVNVSGFGYVPGHCVSSRALRNETYITFLRKRRGRYFVAEINSQVGTIPFKKSTLRKVSRRLRRKGELDKSRNGCAAFFRTARKSSKKSTVKFKAGNAFQMKLDLKVTDNTSRAFHSTTSKVERNQCLGFKPSWIAVLFAALHCVGILLT